MSGVKIVLLCEDKQTDSFVRRFLKHRNFKYRDITTVSLSDGSGSGEQWVRKQYPKELKAIRQREQAYLIVVIDADTHTVDKRHTELKQACEKKGIPPRNSRDAKVLHIIPRRNIETWFEYLEFKDNTNNINEHECYPKLTHESDCRKHAERLHHMCQTQRLREPVRPSLLEACNEYRRLRR